MAGIQGVFHLATIPSVQLSIENPLQTQRSGEIATVVVLEAARRAGVKRVVHSSSCAVYGNIGEKSNNEEMTCRPLTFYGLSKLASEGYRRVFSCLFPEVETVCLRYFNVLALVRIHPVHMRELSRSSCAVCVMRCVQRYSAMGTRAVILSMYQML